MKLDACVRLTVRVILLGSILPGIQAQTSPPPANTNSKRGLANPGTDHPDDLALFFSLNSSISWYHNWSPNPSRVPSSDAHPLDFLPMIHGIDNLRNDLRAVHRLPTDIQNPTGQRKVLSFNEPDGSVASGGSDISPSAAAQAYIDYIAPLQHDPYNMLISHPSVTSTASGIDWLREFNTSCHALRPGTGCPSDFLAIHFYGDFGALAAYLGQIHDFYTQDLRFSPTLPIYITEFALVQSDPASTQAMLTQSLTHLDAQSYVSGYAWFGLFRTNESNSWTGPGVAMLDDGGGLTALGSEYLGGLAMGFEVGERANASIFNAHDGWTWGLGSDETGGFDGGTGGGRINGNVGVRMGLLSFNKNGQVSLLIGLFWAGWWWWW